ncbi:MAG: hypothetical protein ABIJ57_01370 [Pseudomonadota bacterium]
MAGVEAGEMNACKYIMLDDIYPILFCRGMTHIEVSNRFVSPDRQVTSAGFVMITTDPNKEEVKVYTFGKSVSLGIGRKPSDEKWIKKMLTD